MILNISTIDGELDEKEIRMLEPENRFGQCKTFHLSLAALKVALPTQFVS